MNGRRAYLWWNYRLVEQLLDAAKRTQEVQHELLIRKLKRAADSRFGRDHDFRSIRSAADFRRSLPVTTFDYYRPYVERVMRGDSSAMFGPDTKLRMFALTSGTTDKPKYIPVTEEFFREYTRGWRVWGLQTHADHPDLLQKKYLQLTSDWQQFTTGGGIWCGNISGLAAATRPSITRTAFIVPPEVSRIPHWESRQYVALRLSLASRRVGMVITANSLTLVALARLADTEKEALVRDLHDGTLAGHVQVPKAVGRKLRWRLRRRHRARSRELQHIIHRTGTLYPRDFWPDLSVVAVWTGGAAGAFLPQVKHYFGDKSFRDHGLSASEGRMTIPMRDGNSAGLLDLMSHYYEFIPVDQYGGEDPAVLEAHQLEEGRSYYILLTTSSGLYRYDIQDVVRCIGFEETTPILEFLHKGLHCSNVTGEKLTEFQVAAAVTRGFADLEQPMDAVMLAPVFDDPPGYVMLIEPQTEAKNMQLAERIDAHLCDLNCEYAQRLQTRRLRTLSPCEIPAGSWDALREKRIACQGGSLEQYKHTFLTSQTELVSELIQPASCQPRKPK